MATRPSPRHRGAVVAPTETAVRQAIAQARRLVIKIGSSALASARHGLEADRVTGLADIVAARHTAGYDVVIVSSGAIAAGLEPLGLSHRPTDLAQSQAAAAVGQGLLVSQYTQAFARHGIRVAQVLLSVGDLARQTSYSNALRTFGALTRLRVVPVVNENDTVATREISFGDNDRLAALVAQLIRADGLILLSDVDGLYNAHPDAPDAERLSFVRQIATLTVDVSQPSSAGVGRGGMASKLQAARLATAAGIPVVLARWDQADAVLAGDTVGTAFAATDRRRSRRLGWLADASATTGRLHIDAGAAKALTTTPASLLAAGIRRIEGDFDAGDPVDVVGPDGVVVARGLVSFAAGDLPIMLGRTSADLSAALGAHFGHEVIHRDDLVLTSRRPG